MEDGWSGEDRNVVLSSEVFRRRLSCISYNGRRHLEINFFTFLVLICFSAVRKILVYHTLPVVAMRPKISHANSALGLGNTIVEVQGQTEEDHHFLFICTWRV